MTAVVRRVRFGTIVRPAEETPDRRARVEAIDGFLVPMGDDGLLLFDTGIAAGEPEVEAHYRPSRIPLRQALARVGARPDDVTAIANSHLHLDHAGGNADLAGRRVYVQRTELAAAREPGYTVDGVLQPDPAYEVLDGETELAPGLRLVPTPGHTAGHQSLLLDTRHGGLLLAGQTHDTASAWTADVEGVRRPEARTASAPAWLAPLLGRVTEVRFAHDAAVWHA
jgi:N-acyl homoserine lactone hydrolase